MIQESNQIIAFLRYQETILEIRVPLVGDKPPLNVHYMIQGIRRKCTLVGFADGAPYYQIEE